MNDKVVLITGAAHGLGKALVEEFLARDWWVIAMDIDLQEMISSKENKKAWAMEMDVTSDQSVRSAFEKVKTEKIEIDIIINNAGIDDYFPLSEAPVEKFIEVFNVNLFGCYRVNQTFLPIVKKPGGRIINISSESVHLNVPFMPYPISKMALERYTKVLRQELKFQGIDVVVVRPGAIRTGLLEKVLTLKSAVMSLRAKQSNGSNVIASEAQQWQSAVRMKKFAENAPKNIGKVVEPEEVAVFIYKVSQKSNPKAIYKINNSLQLIIAAILPFSLVEKLIKRRLTS